MMSIFILIGAYRYYAGLAERFGKTKWQYGVLAIAIYLFFQVAFLLCYGVYLGITNPDSVQQNSYTGFSFVNLISWGFAIAAVFGIYKLLEYRFTKEKVRKPSLEIEEIGTPQKF